MRRKKTRTGHALEAVADAFKKFRPAREVLTVVRAVPTRFAQFDHATRVGGLPIERFMLVHGPSNEGKSLYTLGLVDSFLTANHFALYIDAERTTPITWARELMGANADSPGFFGERPETYEKTIDNVREFLNTVANLRAKGKVPPETSAIVVCDSLRKLVPKDLMKEILQAIKEEVEDKRRPGAKKKAGIGRDRGGQIKAKMNAAWMDELTPLLEHAQAGFVAIAREMVDPDADKWSKIRGDDYRVGGGGAIFYDSSLAMRVERAGWVQDAYREGEARKVYGERHRVTIKKTKVAGKDDKQVVCHFHSSNGVLVPAGFDRARDVVELGLRVGVLKKPKKGWISYPAGPGSAMAHRWQGENAAVKKLTSDPMLLGLLEREVRAKFDEVAPTEHTSDGEVE